VASLVQLLLKELGDKFKMYGAYLLALDTLLVAKASKKMTGVQKWKDHSSNPDHDGYQAAHNWAVIGLISHFCERYICWLILCRLISGKEESLPTPSRGYQQDDGAGRRTVWFTRLAQNYYYGFGFNFALPFSVCLFPALHSRGFGQCSA